MKPPNNPEQKCFRSVAFESSLIVEQSNDCLLHVEASKTQRAHGVTIHRRRQHCSNLFNRHLQSDERLSSYSNATTEFKLFDLFQTIALSLRVRDVLRRVRVLAPPLASLLVAPTHWQLIGCRVD